MPYPSGSPHWATSSPSPRASTLTKPAPTADARANAPVSGLLPGPGLFYGQCCPPTTGQDKVEQDKLQQDLMESPVRNAVLRAFRILAIAEAFSRAALLAGMYF